jgi:hypothetical protein
MSPGSTLILCNNYQILSYKTVPEEGQFFAGSNRTGAGSFAYSVSQSSRCLCIYVMLSE